MNIVERLKIRAQKNNRCIVFPEGETPEILMAAHQAKELGICRPLILGDAGIIRQACIDNHLPAGGWYEQEDPADADLETAAEAIAKQTTLDAQTAGFLMADPLYYAAMLLRTGRADAMVAGFIAETAEVIAAGAMFVGLQAEVHFPSSYFIMEIPGFSNEEDGTLVYADAGVTIDPSAEELAEISIQTAKSVSHILGWEPRVALLSFSTKGSASHERADKIIDALAFAREKAPELLIDGEMQADAALSARVAQKKVPGGSPVAGRANVLVFPDLDSGNIAYKLTERLTGGKAYGPLLQGFRQPICDLSRGSSVEDILGIICVAAVT